MEESSLAKHKRARRIDKGDTQCHQDNDLPKSLLTLTIKQNLFLLYKASPLTITPTLNRHPVNCKQLQGGSDLRELDHDKKFLPFH